MLIKPIILSTLEGLPKNSSFFNEQNIAIILTPDELVNQVPYILNLSFENNGTFSLCIDLRKTSSLNEVDLAKIMRVIAVCSFHLDYMKKNEAPVISILGSMSSKKELITVFTQKLIIELTNQGYADISNYALDETQNIISGDCCSYFASKRSLSSQQSFLDQLKEFFYKEELSPLLLFIEGESFLQAQTFILECIAVENKFAIENKMKYSRMILLQNLIAERDELLLENERILAKQVNADMNLAYLNKEANFLIDWHKTESNKIRDWYHQEYEALPMLYKKIGHLLKMLTVKKGT